MNLDKIWTTNSADVRNDSERCSNSQLLPGKKRITTARFPDFRGACVSTTFTTLGADEIHTSFQCFAHVLHCSDHVHDLRAGADRLLVRSVPDFQWGNGPGMEQPKPMGLPGQLGSFIPWPNLDAKREQKSAGSCMNTMYSKRLRYLCPYQRLTQIGSSKIYNQHSFPSVSKSLECRHCETCPRPTWVGHPPRKWTGQPDPSGESPADPMRMWDHFTKATQHFRSKKHADTDWTTCWDGCCSCFLGCFWLLTRGTWFLCGFYILKQPRRVVVQPPEKKSYKSSKPSRLEGWEVSWNQPHQRTGPNLVGDFIWFLTKYVKRIHQTIGPMVTSWNWTIHFTAGVIFFWPPRGIPRKWRAGFESVDSMGLSSFRPFRPLKLPWLLSFVSLGSIPPPLDEKIMLSVISPIASSRESPSSISHCSRTKFHFVYELYYT